MKLVDRLQSLGIWLGVGAIIGVLAGSASALFLAMLELATNTRVENEMIVFALPLAGLLMGVLLQRFGQSVLAGNNLVVDTIHEGGPQLPLRMAPIVLLGTVWTHLFGGSAGREGTAVQMGASLADAVFHALRVPAHMRGDFVAAGVAGGFGSVFGTPVAGVIFGLEFVVLGRFRYRALVPAISAAVVGDMVCHAWGVGHVVYPVLEKLELTPFLLLKWIVFGVAMAAATVAFIELTHFLKRHAEQRVPHLGLRMFFGGIAVVGLWQLVGTSDYLGLGIPTILRTFEDPDLGTHVFALKLLFTAVTLSAGYLGGEVTPLFFVGAALGSVLAGWLGIPIEMGAGVGLAAVFAAASNAPLALSVMAAEILGVHVLPHVLIVCVIAYVLTGNRSIYNSQRLEVSKSGQRVEGIPKVGAALVDESTELEPPQG